MNRRRTLRTALLTALCFALVMVLSCANRTDTPDDALLATWLASIEQAEIAMHQGPQSMANSRSDRVVTSAADAEALLTQFEAHLDTLFTAEEKARCLSVFLDYPQQIAEREGHIADTNRPYTEMVGFGCFETEVLECTMAGNTAELTAAVTVWAQQVSRYSADLFVSSFPVNKFVQRIQFVLEGGNWKISGMTLSSDLLMDAPEELEAHFSTLEEAAAQAVTVTPRNLFLGTQMTPTPPPRS